MKRPWTMRRLLIVAAHPDDDAIGAGGTIAIAARGGASISVVYVTDGSRSHPGSRRFTPSAVRDVREAEARASLRCLGVETPPTFLRHPDSGLASLDAAARASIVSLLARAIETFRPDGVLAPWRRDPHADHIVTSALAREAARTLGRARDVGEYAVWLPLRGSPADRPRRGEVDEAIVRLDANALAIKRNAILAHVSQTTDLIDDDPTGFRIDDRHMERWLAPTERFFFEPTVGRGPSESG